MKKIIRLLMILISIIFVGNVYALSSFSVENISVDSKSSTITVEDPVITNNEITSDIIFNQKDDYVTFNLTIMNHESEPYAIQSITDNNTNNKFDISYSYSNDYIKPNETAVVKMTFKYNDTVKNVNKVDISDLTVRLTLINEEGETKGEDIINPTTHDNIFKYIMWLIVAFVGIVLSIIIVKDKKVRLGVMVLSISLLIVPFAIYANEEVKLTIKFTNIELIGEYESYEIQIKDKDGNLVEARTIAYGQKLGTLTHDDIIGYVFDKFVDQNNNEVTEDTIITGPISVIPKYTPNNYQVVFNKNNADAEGSMASQTFTYDVEQALSNNAFTYTGYHFVEWNTNASGTGDSYTNGQSVNNLLTEGSIDLYAIWTENTDTPYVVYHMKQQINGSYEQADKDELTGTTGASITPAVKNYEGFTAPSTTTTTISRLGNTEVTYQYTRNQYNLTIVHPEYVETDKSGKYYYGEDITVKAINRAGYTFNGWSNGDTTLETTITIGANDIDLEPLYTANTNTRYYVDHKYENLNGTYTTETAEESGTTDTTIPAPVQPRTGFRTPTQKNITITGDGEARIDYVYDREEYTFSISDRTYLTQASTANGTYKYGYTVTLEAQERPGYTFKWSDDDTSYTKTFNIDANTSLSLVYTANTNTPYNIVHKYETLNGGWEIVNAPGTGTTDTTIPAPIVSRTGFTDPTQQNITIAGEGNASVTYEYLREEYTFSVSDRTYLTQASTANGTYKYGYTVTLEAQERPGYTFKWSDDDTSYAKSFDIAANTTLSLVYTYNMYHITFNAGVGTCSEASRDITRGTAIGTLPTCTHPQGRQFLGWTYNDTLIDDNYIPAGDIELTASYQTGDYTITFDANGGDPVNPISVTPGQSVNSLPIPTRTSKVFEGWYTNLTDGIKIETPYTPTGDITLIAKWADYLCVKATSLDGVTCGHTDGSKGCRKAYSQGTPYEYGNIIESDTLESGDVFDCNVDGTGYNQRFYYLRTIDDKAALISYTNYEGETGQGNTQSYVYDTALTKLPTTTQWNKLPVTFEVAADNTRAARLLTYNDLIYACGNGTTVTNADLLNCQYIFENSGFESTTTGRNGTWLAEEGGVYKRIQNAQVIIETPNKGADSENTVKPVIEVPLEYINDQYVVRFDPQGGTTTGGEYVRVDKGSAIGTLPTATNGNYIFDGWYTSLGYSAEISTDTVPNGYNTYYAKWIKPVTDAVLNKGNFIIEVGLSDNIVITNVSEIEDHEFVSNDDTIASVDSDGVITALSAGSTTITINGLTSHTSKTVTVNVHEASSKYIVSFDVMGGDPVADMEVDRNTAIGTLPTTTKTDFDLAGWYTDSNYTTQVTDQTIITGDVTFVAKWVPNDAVAEIDGSFFSSLALAFDAVPVNNSQNITENDKTKIVLLKDITEPMIKLLDTDKLNRYVILDLNNKTFTVASGNAIDSQIKFLEIKNGTITSGIDQGVVNVQSGSTLYVTDASLINTYSRQGIYNNGGTVVIRGNSYIENKKDRAAVQNLNNGTTTILGGTIYSKQFYALYNQAGIVTVGEEDNNYDTSKILIKSGNETTNNNQYGLYGEIKLYDGMIMGKKAAINNESNIIAKETDAVKVTDDIIEDTITYHRLYYSLTPTTYKVTLNPNGGEVNPTFVNVNIGSSVGQLPTPTKGVYTFDGWYTNLIDGVLVDEFTVPDGNVTYVAKWHYEASQTIEQFDMTNDAMDYYFDHINTWKNDQSTFQTNMDANFNNYGCKCNENTCSTSGTNLCDKPKGYDTGFSEAVNVYQSSDANKEKGVLITYTTSDDGVIYNMIPGQTYYWELASDPNIYGYVKASGTRRTINIDGVRNVRDLGGLHVDTNGDGVVDGTLKYGLLFRGERLYSDSNNVTQLSKLGVNEEIDLRGSSEIPSTEAKFPTDKYKHREIKHYQIDYDTQYSNYVLSRDLVLEVMQDIVNDKSVYFHCRIGTDRTGTLAYILEGLLGVPEEEMLEDYELSYFFGLVNRHRYYATDPNSSVSKDQKFVYMYNSINADGGVYDWFMQDYQTPETRQPIDDLITAFRNKMIQ